MAARLMRVLPLCVALGATPMSMLAAEEQIKPGRVIEEIIVTAQKREESINDVGMSIQAATGEKLNDLGITDTCTKSSPVSTPTSLTTALQSTPSVVLASKTPPLPLDPQ